MVDSKSKIVSIRLGQSTTIVNPLPTVLKVSFRRVYSAWFAVYLAEFNIIDFWVYIFLNSLKIQPPKAVKRPSLAP